MKDYTVEWINGQYVRVPKRRATRVVTLEAADMGGMSTWRVWGNVSKGADRRAAQLQSWSRVTR